MNSIISERFKNIDKTGLFKYGDIVNITLYNEYLTVTSPNVRDEIIIDYDHIKDVYYGRKVETVHTYNGVERQAKKWLIISYREYGVNKVLRVEDHRLYKGRKLVNTLRDLCDRRSF